MSLPGSADAARPELPRDAGASPVGAVPHHLDPRVQVVWRAAALARLAIVGAALAAVAVLTSGTARAAWLLAGTIVLVLGVVDVAVVPALRWRRWTYVLGADALDLRHGIVTHRASTVPYPRVQHIDLTAGPVDRLLGLTTLVVRTASATTDARIPGVDHEAAERLRVTILERAGLGDAV